MSVADAGCFLGVAVSSAVVLTTRTKVVCILPSMGRTIRESKHVTTLVARSRTHGRSLISQPSFSQVGGGWEICTLYTLN